MYHLKPKGKKVKTKNANNENILNSTHAEFNVNTLQISYSKIKSNVQNV